MICPSCKAKVADNVRRCPYCSTEIQSTGGRTILGKISLTLGIAAIGCVIGSFLLIFSGLGFAILVIVSLLSLLCFLFSILAIILGVIAYFGKMKDRYGLVGFILGICFLVAGFFVISAATYIYVSEWMPEPAMEYMSAPSIFFVQDDIEDTLTIISVYPDDVRWSDIVIDHSSDGGYGHIITSGQYVTEGDQITRCSGTITITHTQTDYVLGSWTFT